MSGFRLNYDEAFRDLDFIRQKLNELPENAAQLLWPNSPPGNPIRGLYPEGFRFARHLLQKAAAEGMEAVRAAWAALEAMREEDLRTQARLRGAATSKGGKR
jgi:hypothetical protein